MSERHRIKVTITKPDGEVLDHMTLVDNDEHPTIELFTQSVAGVLTDHYEEEDE